MFDTKKYQVIWNKEWHKITDGHKSNGRQMPFYTKIMHSKSHSAFLHAYRIFQIMQKNDKNEYK